jgi:hypothetical protein
MFSNSRQSRTYLLGSLVVTTAALLGCIQIEAQIPKFKVGDRVEVDTIEATNPANARWKRGTITLVDTGVSMAYTVEVDALPGQLPSTMHVPIRPYADGWLRPLGGGSAAPRVAAEPLRLDQRNTVLADRALLNCEKLTALPARNGSPLSNEIAAALIRCLYERPADVGSDGASTMDITEFRPMAARRWDFREDRGSAATANTIVFPIRVKWNQKTFYRTYNVMQTGNERVFTCFVDGDKWYCGASQFIRDGEKQQIRVSRM